jgi:hypothetical protein
MIWLAVNAEAVAAVASPSEPAAAIETLEVVVRRPVVGDLSLGVQAYRPEFFTAVRPGTAMDMIRWLPGFTFEDTPDLRGLGAAGGNVLIDGQPPTSKTDTLATVLGRIPANQVDRVDIIVGGAPGIDMRGRAVIANVVLKKTDEPRGAAQLSSTFMQDGRVGPDLQLNISRKTDQRTLEASLTATRSIGVGSLTGSGPLVRTDGSGAVVFVANALNQSRSDSAIPTAAFEVPFAKGRLRVNGSVNLGRFQFIEDAYAPGVVSTNRLTGGRTQGEAGLRFTREVGKLKSESQGLYRVTDQHADNAVQRQGPLQTFSDDELRTEAVLRSTLRWTRDETLALEGAAEGAFNVMDARSLQVVDGVTQLLPAGDVRVAERRADVGVTLTWKPPGIAGLTAALRAETSNLKASRDVNLERTLTYLKPRLVFTLSPNARTQIRLRWEHEVNQIAFSSFASVVEFSGLVRSGNPDIKPRRAWVGEAVLERQFWTGGSLVLTVRTQAIRDAVDSMLIPGFGDAVQIGNIGGGRWTDAIATVTLPLKRVGLNGMMIKGTINRRWTEVTDPTTLTPRSMPTLPWLGELHLAHDLPRWKVNWGVDYVYEGLDQLVRPAVIETFPVYFAFSAFVEYRPRPDITLRAEAFNLNDIRQHQVVAYFEGPRPSPVRYVDTRRLSSGQYLMLRVRKTLN